MSKPRLNAVVVERLFGLVIFLLLSGLVADFVVASNYLKTQASKLESLHQQADASSNDITSLKYAETWLQQNASTVQRANDIVATSSTYQDQVIKDINTYAAQAAVPISGYTFTAPTAAGVPAAPVAATPAAVGAAKAPPGVTANNVSVTLGEDVDYQSFLRLLKLLEQNVTQMQITNMTLTPDTTNPSKLVSPNITLTVYTR